MSRVGNHDDRVTEDPRIIGSSGERLPVTTMIMLGL